MSEQTPGTASYFQVNRHNVAQNIPINVNTPIEFTPPYPVDGLREYSRLIPWYFTPHRAGYYYLHAKAQFGAVLNLNEDIGLMFMDDTLAIRHESDFVCATVAGSNVIHPSLSALMYLTPLDNICAAIVQHQANPLALNGADAITYFCGFRVK
jgi:hypothetical protein